MRSCWNCHRELLETATSCFACGVAASTVTEVKKSNELAKGAVLSGRYELKRKLGQGGMGQVWLASDCVREEDVAIKLVTRELSRDPAAAASFKREANVSLKLTHPHIVRLINYEILPFPYLLMEFVDGRNLWEEMTARGRGGRGCLNFEEMSRLMPPIAEALDYAHKQGVLHRDMKPSNILLAGPIAVAAPKLADFGIAAELRDGGGGGLSGTPEYMAPEQHARRAVDRRADLYSFGVTIYNLLSGKLPYRSPQEVLSGQPPPPIEGLTMSQNLALVRALAVDPDQRPQSALEMVHKLGLMSAAVAQERAAVVSASAPVGALAGGPQSRPGGGLASLNSFNTGQAPSSRPWMTSPPSRPWGAPSVPQPRSVGTPPAGQASPLRTPPPAGPASRPAAPTTVRTEPPDDSMSLESEPVESRADEPGAAAAGHAVPKDHTLIGPNASGRLECTSPKDGATLVLIPGGTYWMGSAEGAKDEAPVHEVAVDDFWIDKNPVTNRQFEAFVRATNYVTTAEQVGKAFAYDGKRFTLAIRGASWRHPLGPNDSVTGKPDHPVVQISWVDANAYAAWAGRRLPTEIEWERAARGGQEGKTYPWGEAPPSGRAWYLDSGVDSVQRVGNFQPNGYGVVDMAGNVWEWCEDWYDDTAYPRRANGDHMPIANGRLRVLRGGCWFVAGTQLRCAYRYKGDPLQGNAAQGFRLALSVHP